MIKKLSLIFLFLVMAAPAAGQMKMEVFPLKNHTVEEMIPVIRPLLGGKGVVTGMEGKLIVRATPAQLAEIRQVLKQLDSALRNLRITVHQGLRRDLESLDAEVSADVELGENGRVIVGSKSKGGGGLTIGSSSGDSEVSGRIDQKSSRVDRMNIQEVVTLEGRPATIHVTQLLPFRERRTFGPGISTYGRETVVFREVPIGFYVLPRVNGNQVILEVYPVDSSYGPGGIDTSSINTTVSGKVGEWIELGGLSQDSNLEDSRILGTSRSQKTENRTVFIKVEIIPSPNQ